MPPRLTCGQQARRAEPHVHRDAVEAVYRFQRTPFEEEFRARPARPLQLEGPELHGVGLCEGAPPAVGSVDHHRRPALQAGELQRARPLRPQDGRHGEREPRALTEAAAAEHGRMLCHAANIARKVTGILHFLGTRAASQDKTTHYAPPHSQSHLPSPHCPSHPFLLTVRPARACVCDIYLEGLEKSKNDKRENTHAHTHTRAATANRRGWKQNARQDWENKSPNNFGRDGFRA